MFYRYPALFTVAERRKPQTFYPVELLSVAPSQRVTLQQQSRDDVASLIKVVTVVEVAPCCDIQF